ncbi:MAG: hypothetical protein LRS43_03470 [Desulfurococcales archaeon]|nr:hypothetical protein [Desulfurococcales archaeon]
MGLCGSIVELLRSFNWRKYGVILGVLFGSICRSSDTMVGDVDVGVLYKRRPSASGVLDLYSSLAPLVENTARIPLDLTVLNWNPPCELVVELFKTGVPVFEYRPGAYLDYMLVKVMECYDWSIVERKLGLTEAARRAVFHGSPT